MALLFFLTQTIMVFSQGVTGLTGAIIDSKSQKPLQYVVISIQNTNETQITSTEGKFSFETTKQNAQLILIHNQGYRDKLIPIQIVSGQSLNLGINAQVI